MTRSVFISRDLSPESPLHQAVAAKNATITGQSLLTFSAVPFDRIPKADWVFFYSQKGVEYFFKQLEQKNITLPRLIKIALMGPKAHSMLQHFNYSADFIGNGNPDDTYTSFYKTCAPDESVLFIQAKNSRQSIQKRLTALRKTLQLVVYDNVKKKAIQLEPHDILIFMSPLNAENYLDHYDILPYQRIICIGKTTATFLQDMGYKSLLPAEPSEKAIAKLLLTLL